VSGASLQKCCKVTLEVQENNRRSRQVYEAAGFAKAQYQAAAGGLLFYSKDKCERRKNDA